MTTMIQVRRERWLRNWRRTEFALLCIVAVYTIAGMFLTNAGLSMVAYGEVVLHDWQDWALVALAFVGLLFVANLVIFPALEFEGDQLLFPLVAFLCATSLMMATYVQPERFRRGVWLFEYATQQARPDYPIRLYNSIPYLSREEFRSLDAPWAELNAANQAVLNTGECASGTPDRLPCPPVLPALTWQTHLYNHFSDIVVGMIALFAILYDPPLGKRPWFFRPRAFVVVGLLVGGVIGLVLAQLMQILPGNVSVWGFTPRKLLFITLILLAARYANESSIRRPLVQLGVLGIGGLALLGAVVTRSLSIPLIGIQVSELLKLLLVVFFAGFGSRIAIRLQTTSIRRQLLRGGLLVAVFGAAALGMLSLRDLGAILVFTTILATYLFLLLPAKTVWPLLFVCIALVGGLGFVGYYILPALGTTHVQARIDLWLNPWANPAMGDGEQIIQAYRAMKYGGLLGQGLGLGRSHHIPAAHTDMAFAVIIEQTGWLGGGLLVSIYLTLLMRGYRIAVDNRRLDRALLAAGITALLGFQTFIILGGTMGAIPLTGITIPFISVGGSAMLLNFVYLGLLLRMSGAETQGTQAPASFDSKQVRAAIPHLAALSPLLFGAALITGGARIIHYDQALSTLQNPHNYWVQIELDRTLRGAILDRHGNPIAQTLLRGGPRVYPDPVLAESLAQTVGYHSSFHGGSGLELAFDARLNGRDRTGPAGSIARTRYLITREIDGRSVSTTLDPDLQKMVYSIMRDPNRVHGAGAALLMEPKTGAIRAVVSLPTFNPATIDLEYAQLRADTIAAPFVNRVMQGAYAPGSVFKILTAAAALDEPTYGPSGAIITPETLFEYILQPAPGPAGYSTVWHGGPCAHTASYHGRSVFNFSDALAYSDNVVFAETAQSIGPFRFEEVAERFGMGRELTVGIPVRMSTLTTTPAYFSTACGLAQTGFGQGELLLTPLQVGMIGAAIANDGKMAYPHLVASPTVKGRDWVVIDKQTAAQVRDMMVAVVHDDLGSGAPARIDGLLVAGKTGTAEAAGRPHAWFVGFAPADNPRYLAVVVLEHQGEGSTWAAPLVRDILAAALGRDGGD